MKIQLISHSNYSFDKIKASKFDNVDTFDSYDINIIDLTSQQIWCCNSNSYIFSNEKDNIISIYKMMSLSSKSFFILVFPSDISFKYNKSSNGNFNKKRLRDNIYGMAQILSDVIKTNYEIEYEPNKIELNDVKYKADFYFKKYPDNINEVLKSRDSGKTLSFKHGKCIYTTINIFDDPFPFIHYYFVEDETHYPEWFSEVRFYNDGLLKNTIEKNQELIMQASRNIDNANMQLKNNDYYKLLVVESGPKLVEVVFDVFSKILAIDLSNFIDEKKEDFNFEINGKTIIGEIKGVNEGIRNSHLSQLENNKQLYMEKENKVDVKGILIINQQRFTSPIEREEIHQNQVKYASDHGLLIIQTVVLLEIFQSFLKEALDIDKFKSSLINSIGVLKEEWK